MSFDKERLLQIVTDPQKKAFVAGLSDDDINLLTSYNWTLEKDTQLEEHPNSEMMRTLRVMYYNRLTDWATSEADTTQQEILDFIDSPTFVQYPDFFLDETIVGAIRESRMNNHSRSILDFLKHDSSRGPGVEVIGARINAKGDVEVMITHNIPKMYGNEVSFFDTEKMDLPPHVKTGILLKNGIPTLLGYGRGGEVYLSIQSPYPGRWGAENYTEIVIGHVGDDGIIMPVEEV